MNNVIGIILLNNIFFTNVIEFLFTKIELAYINSLKCKQNFNNPRYSFLKPYGIDCVFFLIFIAVILVASTNMKEIRPNCLIS